MAIINNKTTEWLKEIKKVHRSEADAGIAAMYAEQLADFYETLAKEAKAAENKCKMSVFELAGYSKEEAEELKEIGYKVGMEPLQLLDVIDRSKGKSIAMLELNERLNKKMKERYHEEARIKRYKYRRYTTI